MSLCVGVSGCAKRMHNICVAGVLGVTHVRISIRIQLPYHVWRFRCRRHSLGRRRRRCASDVTEFTINSANKPPNKHSAVVYLSVISA